MTETESTVVILEAGALARLPAELAALGFSRPFIVSTRGRSKLAAEMQALLGGSSAGNFLDATEHVPIHVVDVAETALRSSRPDVIVAIGGGSPIGLGKALVLRTDIPLAVIPTTYSGSEMTSIYGVTDGRGKNTGRNSRVVPRLVLYDPLLTLDLPADVSASSGMNALAHSVEATYAANATAVTAQWAENSIELLLESLPRIVAGPSNVAARTDALRGSHLAGKALEATSMGLHHRMCHVLGGTFGMPHARTHAVLLPYVAEFNRSSYAAQITTLTRTLPVPQSLAAIGFRENDIEMAAKEIAAASYPNPRAAGISDIVEILEMAFKGR